VNIPWSLPMDPETGRSPKELKRLYEEGSDAK
jgi:hypothetical protein